MLSSPVHVLPQMMDRCHLLRHNFKDSSFVYIINPPFQIIRPVDTILRTSMADDAIRKYGLATIMEGTDGYMKNKRGQKLYYCAFKSRSGADIRGTICFLHGIGEHSTRFVNLYAEYCRQGYAVIAYDMISHGRSDTETDGLRAHMEDFYHAVDDTNEFMTYAKQNVLPRMEVSPTLPLVLSAISFGALVSLHTVLSEKHTFSAIVLASPAIAVEETPLLRLQQAMTQPLLWFAPNRRVVPGVNVDKLCRDQAFIDDYRSDPLVMSDKLTTRMAVEILKGMTHLAEDNRVSDVTGMLQRTPLLVIQGTKDKVTSMTAANEFIDRLPSTADTEFKTFDGYYHCLYNEPGRDKLIGYTMSWLSKRVSTVPSSRL